MNQYGIRVRKKDLLWLTKEQRKMVWDGIRYAIARLRESKGSQHVHASRRVK